MFQMKEQDKAPEEELNEGELDNQPKKEFRVIILKMIQQLEKTMDLKIYTGSTHGGRYWDTQ